MKFSINHPILFLLVGIIICVVLAQSLFFLIKALKRGKEIGISKSKLKKIIISAAIFTVAPAIAIVISVFALSKTLGIPLPWLRLSVIGSMSYETVAAANSASAMDFKLGEAVTLSAEQYITITSVMTISILVGIWLVPVIAKKMQKGMINMEKRDKKWSDIFQNSLFIGMISAFLGFVFCDVGTVTDGNFSGLIPVLVMVVSALVVVLCAVIMKLTRAKWLNDYALPLSLILGMASAIPITNWLS